MTEITASVVKALREETGLGMMQCKKALQEVGGDMEEAKILLRKKGLDTADTKAGRATKEGLIGICTRDGAAMVEIQCETDFVARNETFRQMVQSVADMACQLPDGPIEPNDAIDEAIQVVLAKMGENMGFARGVKLSAPCVGSYLHHNGKVGVLVGVDGEITQECLSDLCMQIAFADPIGITKDDIPADLIERERDIATHQASESGKPPPVVEKIVAGKIGKFLAENALLEQVFIRDEKKKVKDILGSAKIICFARFAVGAGDK